MRILTKNQIKKAIWQCNPIKIAVAYIGCDWDKYLQNINALEAIIISPTLGTNPKAVENLARKIGWEKIFFLNELHAKIYVGHSTAVIGSANLTDNGLNGEKLVELCVEIEERTAHERIDKIFDEFKIEAQKQYLNTDSKKHQLLMLKNQLDKAQWHSLVIENKSEQKLSEFNTKTNLERIHIAWYQPVKKGYAHYDLKKIPIENPNIDDSAVDNYYTSMYFLEEDDIQVGDWILCWQCNINGFPRKNGNIEWMQVHCVIEDAVRGDEPYTKFVGQANDLKTGTPPFKLDNNAKQIIRDALESGEFFELISSDDSTWRLKPADKVTPRFLKYIQDNYSS